MWINNKRNLEFYILEALRKAEKYDKYIQTLLTKQFPSSTPSEYLSLLKHAGKYLEKKMVKLAQAIEKLHERDSDSLLHKHREILILEDLLLILWSHLKYIEGATFDKVPWSIIQSIESYLRKISRNDNIKILFRPLWEYNFSVIPENLITYYKDLMVSRLSKLSDAPSIKEIENEIENDIFFIKDKEGKGIDWNRDSLFVFSFPGLDKRNIMLHSLIGHEIGHLIASDVLSKEFFNNHLTRLKDLVTEYLQQYFNKVHKLDMLTIFREGDIISKSFLYETINRTLKQASDMFIKGINELAADFVGTLLFGPSMLYSIYFFSIYGVIDSTPSEVGNYYPPRRLRLRLIFDYLENNSLLELPPNILTDKKKEYNGIMKAFRELVSKKTDVENIGKDDICSIVYNKMIFPNFVDVKKDIIRKLGDNVLSAKQLYENLGGLLERLECQLPPNALENKIDKHEICDLAEILNASWLFNITSNISPLRKGDLNGEAMDKKNLLDRLTLKGIEYAHLEKVYDKYRVS